MESIAPPKEEEEAKVSAQEASSALASMKISSAPMTTDKVDPELFNL